MKKLILLFFVLIVSTQFAQQNENVKDINKVWENFCKAFKTLDYKLFAELHDTELIRVPNGRKIVSYDDYIASYEKNFTKDKAVGTTREISLRFFERVSNDSVASERGYYRAIKNGGTKNRKISYGEFHVLLVKRGGDWKILMDYDNSQKGDIGKAKFEQARDMYEAFD